MAISIKRQPFSVSTNSNDYPKEQVFNQINFKGLQDNKNDIVADGASFISSKNIYVDENNILVSRAPFKISDDEAYILNQWSFGEYTIRFHKILVNENEEQVTDPQQYVKEQLSYIFLLRCISHETIDMPEENVYGSYGWKVSLVDIDSNYEPTITHAHIEDKIFFWFNGMSLVAFNTAGYSKNKTYLPYFEDAQKYLYIPITELIVNGFTNDLEEKNFLTDSFRRRYQHSIISTVNFDSLIDKELSVTFSDTGSAELRHLYDILVEKNSDKILLFPYSIIGENYHVDIVQTPRTTVVLRFGLRSKRIEVSFDAKYFRSIPYVEGILGTPQFTKDGLYLIAFTETAILKYKLVAQETSDFEEDNTLEEWIRFPYGEYAVYNNSVLRVEKIDTSFVPICDFHTIDQFSYIFQASDIFGYTGTRKYIYVQWLRTDGVYAGINPYSNTFSTDELKMNMKYIPANLTRNTGAIVSILGLGEKGNCLDTISFEGMPSVSHKLYNGDRIIRSGLNYYVYKLTADLKNIETDFVPIKDGDNVILSLRKEDTLANAAITFDDGTWTRSTTMREIFLTETSNGTSRYVLRNKSGKQEFELGDEITIETPTVAITYTAFDIGMIYGESINALTYYKTPTLEAMTIPATDPVLTKIYTQHEQPAQDLELSIAGIETNVRGIKALTTSIVHSPYRHTMFAKDADLFVNTPEWSTKEIKFSVRIAYNAFNDDTEISTDFITRYEITMDKLYDNDKISKKNELSLNTASSRFRFDRESGDLLSDTYLYAGNEVIYLPEELRKNVRIDDRELRNRDCISLSTNSQTLYDNIYCHKLTDDGLNLSLSTIRSGDLVSISAIDNEYNYLKADTVFGNRWYVEKLGIDKNAKWQVLGGTIEPGDIVRFRAYDKDIILPANNPGNDTGSDLLIEPTEYPLPPEGWVIGDGWPETWPWLPPWRVESDYTVRTWQPGEALPIGSVELYGMIGIKKSVIPISLGDTGAWYLIDNQLWTSQMTDDVVLYFDEYVDCDNRKGVLNKEVPTHFETLDEHYFSFEGTNGKHLLEITSTRYDEEKDDFLLYLPKSNEQIFPEKITNLCPLSESTIGIFTDNSVWYISSSVVDGALLYTKPVKSKIPVGCRDGNEIIIALDGQALILPTQRGIAAMRPELLTTDTEQVLSYLSDAISDKYNHFYNDLVHNISFIPNELDTGYEPCIKICVYRYWIVFYRFFDREILLFDTRSSSWWSFTTPYPIRQIDVGSRMNVIMQVDYSPIKNGTVAFPTSPASLVGVPFVFADDEMQLKFANDEFPQLTDDVLKYKDDIIENTLNGTSELKYENQQIGHRRILHKASSIIDWHFTSQRLHFGQISNFKTIKNISLNLKGTKTTNAKLSTKVFRDFYHPEQSSTMEMQVNDLRTFIKHLNLMHVIDFQYKIENDTKAEPFQFRLNGVSIKYETKEKIR